MRKNNRNIGIITLLKLALVIVVGYTYYYFTVVLYPDIPDDVRGYKKCLEVYNNEFKGTIVKNWNSTRGGYFTKISNGAFFRWRCSENVRRLILYEDSAGIWELLEVGDSIYKPAGTFDAYVYKRAYPDSVILLECDFDCKTKLRDSI